MQTDFPDATSLAVVSALGGALVAWLVFTLRGKALERGARTRASESAEKRFSVARELHDTLLQGVQGLVLTFHVVAQKMTANEETRVLMERALLSADTIVIEARTRVCRLLDDHVSDAELAEALRNSGNDVMRTTGSDTKEEASDRNRAATPRY